MLTFSAVPATSKKSKQPKSKSKPLDEEKEPLGMCFSAFCKDKKGAGPLFFINRVLGMSIQTPLSTCSLCVCYSGCKREINI